MTAHWHIGQETPIDEPDTGPLPVQYRSRDFPWPLLLVFFLLCLWGFARSGVTTTWVEPKTAAGPLAVEFIVLPPAQALSAASVTAPEPDGADERPDPHAFAAPYDSYAVTQGPHGQSYGHLAIDLAAGKGTPVLSPINGTVSEVYTDQWGNPTLIIENEVYQVKLLHGIYSVVAGEEVRIGDPVGTESNLGYTTDMRGVPCSGRADPCGYHTHLNVYDKLLGENVNPLNLIRDGG